MSHLMVSLMLGVKKEDAGNFVCSALSVAGSAVEKAQLTVTVAAENPPPVIVFGPANQTLAVNAIAILPCRGIGQPVPTIHWLKDDVTLALDNFSRMTLSAGGTLQIFWLEDHGFGNFYLCSVVRKWKVYVVRGVGGGIADQSTRHVPSNAGCWKSSR